MGVAAPGASPVPYCRRGHQKYVDLPKSSEWRQQTKYSKVIP